MRQHIESLMCLSHAPVFSWKSKKLDYSAAFVQLFSNAHDVVDKSTTKVDIQQNHYR